MKRCKPAGLSLWLTSIPTIAIALCLFVAAWQPAAAAAGPFSDLAGTWTGNGKIRVGDNTERIRCRATYRLSGEHNVNLSLACTSDTYKFDLTGDFTADEQNNISGQWTERSRSVGGTAIGAAHGDRFRIHIETAAFAGNLNMVTRHRRQSVSIDTHGGGQVAEASITLSRN
ncbi:MAG: hypothetical protein ACREB8_14625 [Pseudolabrys sp.]